MYIIMQEKLFFREDIMKKRILSLALAAAMALSLTACTGEKTPPETTSPAPTALYTAGTYTGAGTGKNGPVKVNVTFSDTAITKVEVTEHTETEGIADAPVEKIPAAIVDRQTLAVDAIAGATITSDAILAAVEDAVTQAGGDVEALKKPVETSAETKTEEMSCEVVVVGAGAAGTAAALAAAEAGADVVLLEKTASPMGGSTLAGAMFAADSQQQKDRGTTVDKEWLYDQYIELAGGYINSILVRRVIDEAGATVDWLNENGCLTANVDAGTGGSFEHIGMPATAHGYQEGGTMAITKLIESFESKGGTMLFSTPATGLLYAADGSVSGVTAKREDGTVLNITAQKVILATGGFGGNEEMLAEYIGEPYTLGEVAQNMGDGVKMAWEAGAAKEGQGVAQYFWQTFQGEEIAAMQDIVGEAWWALSDFSKYPNLRVNLDGKRFSDETNATLYAVHGAQLHMQPQETEFVIIDSAMLDTIKTRGTAGVEAQFDKWKDDRQFFMEFNEPNDTAEYLEWENTPADYGEILDALAGCGVVFKGNSLEELADSMGVNKENFMAAAGQYNNAIATGEDELFFADTERLLSLEKGPYYAVKFSTRNLGTLGGVRVNENLQAVDKEGATVPNLYVAGSDAGGMYGKSYVDFEGGTLGFAYTSGRIAGLSAAQELGK